MMKAFKAARRLFHSLFPAFGGHQLSRSEYRRLVEAVVRSPRADAVQVLRAVEPPADLFRDRRKDRERDARARALAPLARALR